MPHEVIDQVYPHLYEYKEYKGLEKVEDACPAFLIVTTMDVVRRFVEINKKVKGVYEITPEGVNRIFGVDVMVASGVDPFYFQLYQAMETVKPDYWSE